MERQAWWAADLSLLYFAVVSTRVGFGVIIIIFPTYLSGLSYIQLAAILASYPVLEALFSLPVGGFCDAHGRKRVFVLGLAAMAVLVAGLGLTRNVILVSIIHALAGIAAAAITISSLTMITDLTEETNRGKGMGGFDFANIAGYAIGLIAGGRLHDMFVNSLGTPFLITAGVLAVGLGVSLVLLREPMHTNVGKIPSLNPMKFLDARTKAILPIWLSLTCLLGIVFFLPRVLRELGMQATVTGEVLFIGIMVLGTGSVGFGALSDKFGRERIMAIGVVGLFGLLISLALSFAQRGGPPLFVYYLPILGPSALATSALVPSILAAVGDRVKEQSRGAAMGIYGLMLSAGIAVGELLAGSAHYFGGIRAILYAGAAVFAVASVMSFLLLRRVRKLPVSVRI